MIEDYTTPRSQWGHSPPQNSPFDQWCGSCCKCRVLQSPVMIATFLPPTKQHPATRYYYLSTLRICVLLDVSLLQELQHAAVVRLQAKVRAWIGHKRCTAWGEVKRQRVRDIDISSRKIQASDLFDACEFRCKLLVLRDEGLSSRSLSFAYWRRNLSL